MMIARSSAARMGNLLGYTKMISVLALFSLSTLLLLCGRNEQALLISVVPAIYGLLFVVGADILKLSRMPGMFTLSVVCAVRYVVIPFLIVMDGGFPDGTTLTSGITLMIYEEICVGAFMTAIVHRSARRLARDAIQSPISTVLSARSGWIIVLITLAGLGLAALNPQYLKGFNLSILRDHEIHLYGEVASGVSSLILDWTRILLPIVITNAFVRRYKTQRREVWYYLTLIIILFFNLMIFKGISRASALLPGVASLFFLLKVFPERKTKTIGLVATAIVVVGVSLTIFKNAHIGVNDRYTFSSFTSYTQAYFVGPVNLSNATTAVESYRNAFSYRTAMNDLFYGIPGLSRFFDSDNRTTTMFNLAVYYGGAARDAIIPTVGQGLFYFGYVFSVIPELFLIWLTLQFDRRFLLSRDTLSAFILALVAVSFGYFSFQNLSIAASTAGSTVIPGMVLIVLNRPIRRTEGTL